MLGVLIFCLVYVFYYKGGDTVNYFIGAKALSNLLIVDFKSGFEILINSDSPYNSIYSFNNSTGIPPHYMWKDPNTFSVCRFTSILVLLSNGSFIATSFLTSALSYIGIWKLYRLFCTLYKEHYKGLAYLILFVPTLLFWGSGIMKDSYVLGSTCWITYNFYKVFIKREKLFWNIILIFINALILFNTKTYVIISLLPGIILWINSVYLKQSTSILTKIIKVPFFIIIFGVGGYYSLINLSSLMGVYGDMDSAIEQAQIIQKDLLREEAYGSNNYNIGEIDGSVGGLVSLAPLAIFTAIYRPLFWEIGSPMMIISVIENTILLIFSLFLLFNTGIFRLIRILFNEPILLYAFVFSILFAFGVGIAGTNFGALVRYKIPLVPFYFPMIFLVYKLSRKK